MKKILLITFLAAVFILSGCADKATPPAGGKPTVDKQEHIPAATEPKTQEAEPTASSLPAQDKFSCLTASDCVDGSYCEKTSDGCVNSEWWWEHVGNKFDCEPDPNACRCENNRCMKK